jgi:predicted lipoprotein
LAAVELPASAGTEETMRRFVASIVIVLIAMGSPAMAAGHVAVKAPITRIERCDALQQQLDHAIIQHARAKRATQARALRKKAEKFCAGKSQAQGIRTYATALKLLGVKPIDE